VLMARPASERPYGGVDATKRKAERRGRLVAAGLDLLGADQQDTSALTVRAVCRLAGLTPRYFYESFSDKDEFVGAVFDWVVAGLAATTQAAVAAVPAHEQARAAMANIVRTIAGDARVGRLLFSTQLADAVIVRKRAESSALFAMLTGQQAGDTLRIPANDRMKAGRTSWSAAWDRHSAPGWRRRTARSRSAGRSAGDADRRTRQPTPVRPQGNSGRCQSRIFGSSSHKRIMVSRMMRCAPVIMKIANGTSIPSPVTTDSQTSSGPAVIRSNHASQISSTPT